MSEHAELQQAQAEFPKHGSPQQKRTGPLPDFRGVLENIHSREHIAPFHELIL